MTIQEILQGVHDWTNGKIVYNISSAHPDGQGNPTPYANLKEALGTNGVNIPESLRKGGMSVKFVQSSDNKYVQYRCMDENFTTDVTQWQGVDEEPILNSNNLATSNSVAKLKNEVLDLESMSKKYEANLLTPFVQGAVSQESGAINPSATTSCYIGKLQMKAGESVTYSRSVNKIKEAVHLVIYDIYGNFISGRAVANGVTITFKNDGMFAVQADLNNVVSATMEEAINAANTSLIFTTWSYSDLVENVVELNNFAKELKDENILSFDGIVESEEINYSKSDLLNGYHYSVSNGIVSRIAAQGSSKYMRMVDVSALKGKRLTIHCSNIRNGSVRAYGFCNSQNQVSSYWTEGGLVGVSDGTRFNSVMVDNDFFFFSCSVDVNSLKIKISGEYMFQKKEVTDFKSNIKKYYHVSFDDVNACLKDITNNVNTYESIFDNDFFNWCKSIHDRFGTTFSMYVFYTDGGEPAWDLTQCTNAFANEFIANSDWLKFGFHAYNPSSNVTSREASAGNDYVITITELIRITGSIKCIDRAPRLHNYNGTLIALKAMRDSNVGCVGFLASADYSLTEPRDSYYFTQEENDYIFKHCYMADNINHLHFVKTSYLWGSSNISILDKENDAKYANLNKYVELFTHENQLTSGIKAILTEKITQLSYSHQAYYLQNLVLTT